MKIIRIGTLVCACLLTAACMQDQPAATQTQTATDALGAEQIAAVDGQRIPTSVFNHFTRTAQQREADSLNDQERALLVEQIVTIQLLANAATQDGLTNEQEIAAELEYARLQLLARAMTQKYSNENPPTEAELRQVYEDNLPRLANTQYRARHILVETEDEAASLIEQLNDGADFAELAREHSTGPTAPDGGDLGWFSAESMVAPFAAAVVDAEVGVHVPMPVQTRFGWHVIRVEEKREQEPPGLESVRTELMNEVARQKLSDYISSLRERAEVTIEE